MAFYKRVELALEQSSVELFPKGSIGLLPIPSPLLLIHSQNPLPARNRRFQKATAYLMVRIAGGCEP